MQYLNKDIRYIGRTTFTKKRSVLYRLVPFPLRAPSSGGTITLSNKYNRKIYIILNPAAARIRVDDSPPASWEKGCEHGSYNDFGIIIHLFCRVIDVTLGTIRVIFIIRGDRVPAAAIGFVEIMVYTTALGMVIGSLDNPVKLVIFCAGFAMGVLSGSIIEEKLALRYRGIQVTIDAENSA